jgi:large subunit ribosomal protein L21
LTVQGWYVECHGVIKGLFIFWRRVMYAMIDFGGNQLKVIPGTKVRVFNLNKEEGETIENKNVLLVADGEEISVGKPYVENAVVKLQVLRNFKGTKIIVFKKRRRKASKVKRGFRPSYTELKVLEILK